MRLLLGVTLMLLVAAATLAACGGPGISSLSVPPRLARVSPPGSRLLFVRRGPKDAVIGADLSRGLCAEVLTATVGTGQPVMATWLRDASDSTLTIMTRSLAGLVVVHVAPQVTEVAIEDHGKTSDSMVPKQDWAAVVGTAGTLVALNGNQVVGTEPLSAPVAPQPLQVAPC